MLSGLQIIFNAKYHYLHFTGEKTESQRGEIIFPGTHTYQSIKLGNTIVCEVNQIQCPFTTEKSKYSTLMQQCPFSLPHYSHTSEVSFTGSSIVQSDF